MRGTNWVRTLVLWVLASVCSPGAWAQLPPGPLACPAESALHDVVCKYDSMVRLAFETERQLFAAAVVDPLEALSLRKKWQDEFVACKFFIGQHNQLRACVQDSLQNFGERLSTVAPPTDKSREDLFRSAYINMGEMNVKIGADQRECVRREAIAVDDGVSPARDIAVVIAKRCRESALASAGVVALRVDLALPFMSEKRLPANKAMEFADSMSEPDNFIESVLELRAAKRKATPPSPSPAPKAPTPRMM